MNLVTIIIIVIVLAILAGVWFLNEQIPAVVVESTPEVVPAGVAVKTAKAKKPAVKKTKKAAK